MNETPEIADAQSASGATLGRPLGAMRVADLQTIAQGLGIKGAARMRKNILIEAIEAAQSGKAPTSTEAAAPDRPQEDVQAVSAPAETSSAPKREARRRVTSKPDAPKDENNDEPKADSRGQGSEPAPAVEDLLGEALDSVSRTGSSKQEAGQNERGGRGQSQRGRQQRNAQASEQPGGERKQAQKPAGDPTDKSGPKTLDDIILPPAREDGEDDDVTNDGGKGEGQQSGRKRSRNRNRGKGTQNDEQSQPSQQKEEQQQNNQPARGEEQAAKQNSRQRDRKRNNRDDADPEIAPDDVLLPIAGILDVLDNYAFVRTSGYLAGVNDVYVSLGQVKKYGLRKGDAIVGAIRQPRDGEHHGGRQKYNALVRVDTINGEAPDSNRERLEFDNLTPLYPSERIELETENGHAAQRMIDLFAPIGKGTRGLIIAPPKSGKSIMLERIANAIAQNSPDTHLMLVLVDERPEEVTRLERTIHGEVVASTFDMPAENHTTIAELAIERAKRLVELGLDVVVLLDSITQLCRAYNLTAPASGRILAGGVDASALYPPKRFFGAARKVENGGSLTILATAMVETGSRTDEVILEEFAGTGNMELRLSREIADKRIFPALDIQQSSTLHEEQLLSEGELEVTWAIRRALHGDAQASLEAVLERISSTSSNDAFLASVRANPISTVNAQ